MSAMVIEEQQRGRQRHRKWGDESTKFNTPGLPTHLPQQLSNAQLSQYLRMIRIEQIGIKLRTNDHIPRSPSPSPEPVYGPNGKRINTRDVRYKRRLEAEWHKLIEDALKIDPLYRPPADYKRPSKFQEKVWIPANEFPELNFIGLLIGPRGNTLKKIESESGGAKISIRGKGSAKEGGKPQPAEDEELHALVTADTNEKVQKAVFIIEDIIERSCSNPEQQNELKQQQLRELALINGTLRDNGDGFGGGSGAVSLKKDLQGQIACKLCGGFGHVQSDCKLKNNPEAIKAMKERENKADVEYDNLMAEVFGEQGSGGANLGQNEETEMPWRLDVKMAQMDVPAADTNANAAGYDPLLAMQQWGYPAEYYQQQHYDYSQYYQQQQNNMHQQ